MHQKGITFVKDLFDDHLLPVSFENLKHNYSLRNFPFTTYYGILSAIPAHWKDNMMVLDITRDDYNAYDMLY